jgi:hypothetical protein
MARTLRDCVRKERLPNAGFVDSLSALNTLSRVPKMVVLMLVAIVAWIGILALGYMLAVGLRIPVIWVLVGNLVLAVTVWVVILSGGVLPEADATVEGGGDSGGGSAEPPSEDLPPVGGYSFVGKAPAAQRLARRPQLNRRAALRAAQRV